LTEFLLEIYTEEMPPSHVKGALSQLQDFLSEELMANNLIDHKNSYGSISTYGTCRRLIVLGDFVERQMDREEQVIGPPKAVAFAADGVPKPAALGFAKSQGVSLDALEVMNIKKGEYLGLKKIIEGRPTQDILEQALPKIISRLTFPKMMCWGESSFRFSRPIKNILCLFGGKLLSFSVAGVHATHFTSGHKIHSPKKLEVHSFGEYKEKLKKNKVIVQQQERKRMILAQIKQRLSQFQSELYPDEDLLDKLTYDVEHPYVFLGSFPQEYLKLPLEVLSTAMREGQNLFSVMRGKRQLPYFLGVADSIRDSKQLIRRGNERVLKARLEDAKFFWEQDLETHLKEKAEGLDQVIYQEHLGTYHDKAERLKKIVSYFSDKLEASEEKKAAIEAAELCKADLITEMVREFPSLQGKVGGLYAKEQGYPSQVWRAIYEHYKPVSLDDSCPSAATGYILSAADKLDAIVGAVGMGVEVSGSKDPYGLRRNAQGISKIILEKKLSFSFPRLLDKVIKTYGETLNTDKGTIKTYVIRFFVNRLQHIFESQGFRYDLVNACLGPGIENIYHTSLRLKALDNLKDSPQFEPMILIAKRVNNILRDQPRFKVNEEFLLEKQERELYTTFSIIKSNVLPLISKGDFAKAQRMIFRMRSALDNFFDHVLVMSKDKKIKKNRLAILQEISQLLARIADYSKVVVEKQA
jgi:glycyl-tRNA synthetase beta chain